MVILLGCWFLNCSLQLVNMFMLCSCEQNTRIFWGETAFSIVFPQTSLLIYTHKTQNEFLWAFRVYLTELQCLLFYHSLLARHCISGKLQRVIMFCTYSKGLRTPGKSSSVTCTSLLSTCLSNIYKVQVRVQIQWKVYYSRYNGKSIILEVWSNQEGLHCQQTTVKNGE